MRHKYGAYYGERTPHHLSDYEYLFDDEPAGDYWKFMSFVGSI
jgi:hypothetical protein